MSWLANNIGTVIITLILAAIVTLIIIKMLRDKKKGKSACGCGCAGCAMAEKCRKNHK